VNEELVHFFEKNLKSFPGRSGLKFNIKDPKNHCKVCLHTMESGFEMNDEMAAFLQTRPEVDVQVVTA